MCKKHSDLIELDQMNGHTGRPDAPSWLTFEEDDHPLPDDPRRYCLELALTSIDAVDVYTEQGIVEVSVPGQHLPAQVYKPCSLDAFHPCTRFRPDSDARPYGYTCPQDAGLHGRPELITDRFAYRNLKNLQPDDILEIRCLQPPTVASPNASNTLENGP